MRPTTAVSLSALLLLPALLALDSLAARPAPPPIPGTRAETEDEDFSAGPSRTTAISLARDAGDAIDDSVMPQSRIAGVENFTGKLDRELLRYGVDHPRYQILKSAEGLLQRIKSEELGEEAAGQVRSGLPSLRPPSTSASAPVGGMAPARSQMKVRSKPVRYPDGLGMSEGEITRSEFGVGGTLDGE